MSDHLWRSGSPCRPCGARHRPAGGFDSPLRSEASPAQIVAINPDDLDETQKQIFWGRSPAARWRISITPQDAAAAELDLTGLTEIQLAVKYAYFNPTAGSARKKPAA